ncbi:hypothetical protein PssvBMR1_gp24 [Pseudomonas phage MR1]|uniref:Uncharacterized protein n=1 Tax=Pseudomonas phage MR1 TaxID=2711169 RepID=A0A6M3T8J8_9CAUD|nr:hypothetical protein PssvBMR1_gp24 [Pseudomonas phage MR1]
MAITLKANVNFGLRLVVNTGTIAAVEVSRALARVAVAEGKPMKGESAAMVSLFASEITTESLMETIMRKGIRELVREHLEDELNNDETTVRVGNVKVAFEAPAVPVRKCELHDDRKGCTSLCKRMLVTQ